MKESNSSVTDRYTPTSDDFNGLERPDPDLIQAQMNNQAMIILASVGTWFAIFIGGLVMQACQ